MNNGFDKKWFWFTAFILILLVLSPLLFTKISRAGKWPVDIVVAPSAAKVLINNNKASSGTNYLKPGSYTVIAQHEDFDDLELPLTVVEGENAPITLMLTPITPRGWEIARNDPAFLELEEVVGEIAAQQGDDFVKTNPITEFLPYRSGLFNIDYRLKDNSESEIVLIVTVHEQEREYPQEQIREWGFDPADFEIEYRPWW